MALGMTIPREMAAGIDRRDQRLDVWRCLAEAAASEVTSASCYHLEENVGIVPIVKTKLKLVQVERQIIL